MDWSAIREEYETTDISLTDLADKHNIKYPTIKSRKQRQSWSKDASLSVKDASNGDKDASQKRRGPPKGNRNAAGHGAPKGNKNALGNSGGTGGPYGNDKAVTHGFFRKFLPDDTAEIMDAIEDRSPLDMIWDQIMIQYAAILRAQQIMFVKDSEDVTKVLTESADNAFGGSEKWEYQHAWDKHAAFMNAQSRAMTTLQGLIKRYEEMCRLGYADEEQQLRIKKLKGEVEKISGEEKKQPIHITVDYGDGS
ncbi:phage terminase small subunit [Paenibacillus polymyxa]|uniref:phage terminase small subunit n=1 Tax=Paenibacillus polymyxa TaxID=1406 RepID=UPI000737D033|nr:phage terminase small subunit [Paenibacillus polymyxa]